MKQSDLPENMNQNNNEYPKAYFDQLRNEDHSSTFSATRQWLQTINNNSQTKKPERLYNIMKNYLAKNKFKLAYSFVILLIVVAACNYPVTQQETVSDVITWSIDENNTDALKQIKNMDWFKSGSFTENINEQDGKKIVSYRFIVPKEGHDKIREIKSQLESVSGVRDVNLVPINETVTRPVYSMLLNNMFKIDINASNMSDQELEKEITSQLKNAGIEVSQVEFEKAPDGSRRVSVVVPNEQLEKEGGFDMTIQDGNNKTRIKEMRKEGNGERFKNKTDAEIRDMVREDIGKDLRDDQIEIVRKDGKVMVKVKNDQKGMEDKMELEMDTK